LAEGKALQCTFTVAGHLSYHASSARSTAYRGHRSRSPFRIRYCENKRVSVAHEAVREQQVSRLVSFQSKCRRERVSVMNSRLAGIGLLLVMFGAAGVKADDSDLGEGLALFNKECSVCHGVISHTKTGDLTPVHSQRPAVHVAMAPSTGRTAADFPIALLSNQRDAIEGNDGHQYQRAHDQIAFVPLYGPPLKGVIGRVAGTYSGYGYSKAFLQKMDGVIWDEAKIDKWITSSQTMVPGSFMFYSHKSADVRSKIIEYLKAVQAQ
jgi:cytochrome c2